MRITEVEALVSSTRQPFIYAKITTSNGLVGYGECEHMFGYASPDVFTKSIEALGKYVIGMDPFDTELLWYTLTQTFHMWNAQGNLGAIGAIDTALLDIKGKALGTPVYNLLGGKFRDKIRLYCHILVGAGPRRKDVREKKTTPEMVAEDAKDLVKLGFTVLKFDPFTVKYVRQRVNIPICVGERRYFVDEFRRLFELEATDIIMPDTSRMRLSWLKKIADMALVYHVPVAPHVVYSSPLNAVITAHVCASIPNFLISESMGPQRMELYKDLLKPQVLPENGYLKVPDRPGLGVELNEDNLSKKYDTQEFSYNHRIW